MQEEMTSVEVSRLHLHDGRSLSFRSSSFPAASLASFSGLGEKQQKSDTNYLEELRRKADNMILSAEYVIGLLVGTAQGISLLTSAMALVGGLSEALINLKAFFPGDRQPCSILILTTLEAVPLYAAVLGIFVQVIGDPLFTIACICLLLFDSAGLVTAVQSLNLSYKNSNSQGTTSSNELVQVQMTTPEKNEVDKKKKDNEKVGNAGSAATTSSTSFILATQRDKLGRITLRAYGFQTITGIIAFICAWVWAHQTGTGVYECMSNTETTTEL